MSKLNQPDVAVDKDGTIINMTPAEVRAHVLKMVDEGEVMAAVVRLNGEIGVQVYGPPSLELLDILTAATRGYRKALRNASRGH